MPNLRKTIGGSLLALTLVAFSRTPVAPVTLYLIGDSTMADKPDPANNPERGWGQEFPKFVDSAITVRNHAVNGRSTKSFIDEGKWDVVKRELKRGDFVFIEFGHNDEKSEDSTRYAAPMGAYTENLRRFVNETRAAGATPVLFTPIVRRNFNTSGQLTDTHGLYPDAVRALAKQDSVALVDLGQLTAELLKSYGDEKSKALFVWTSEGQFPAFPLARRDNTHLSPLGAELVAQLAATQVRAMKFELAKHILMPK